jgi:hypothetical protein
MAWRCQPPACLRASVAPRETWIGLESGGVALRAGLLYTGRHYKLPRGGGGVPSPRGVLPATRQPARRGRRAPKSRGFMTPCRVTFGQNPAQNAQDSKFEAPNPKSETSSNLPSGRRLKTRRRATAFGSEHWEFGFVSDFGIRISNFPGAALGSDSGRVGNVVPTRRRPARRASPTRANQDRKRSGGECGRGAAAKKKLAKRQKPETASLSLSPSLPLSLSPSLPLSER